MSESCTAIIDRLIEKRREMGMTQKELALASGLTQSVIARFESKRTVPQLDTLLKVASALGCELTISSIKCKTSEKSEIRRAVEAMISESEKAARGEAKYYTYEEVFNT